MSPETPQERPRDDFDGPIELAPEGDNEWPEGEGVGQQEKLKRIAEGLRAIVKDGTPLWELKGEKREALVMDMLVERGAVTPEDTAFANTARLLEKALRVVEGEIRKRG
jgi:hypothetical protein